MGYCCNHRVGGSWHFMSNKPLCFWYTTSYSLCSSHCLSSSPQTHTQLTKTGHFPFATPVAVWYLTSTSSSFKQLYCIPDYKWERLRSTPIFIIPNCTTLTHTRKPQHNLHTNWLVTCQKASMHKPTVLTYKPQSLHCWWLLSAALLS